MAFGLSFSKKKAKDTSSFNERVWGPQADFLKQLYGDSSQLFQDTQQNMTGLNGQAVQNQQNVYNQSSPHWQNQMAGGAYRDMNLGQNMMRSLNESSNSPSAMQEMNNMIMGGSGNNYADALQGQIMESGQRVSDQMNASLDARAAGAGMGGSSRHGVSQGIQQRGINDAMQREMAKTGYNTFDKDLDRKLQIASQADQANFGRQQMMSNMLNQQQGAMNQGLLGGMNQQNLNMGQYNPYTQIWDPMMANAQVVGQPTVLGSGQRSASNSGWGFSGQYGK